MQTFIPFADPQRCAAALDRLRLGKQRVETKQIISTLRAGSAARGWAHHPAVTMWRGHEVALAEYGRVMCREWRQRGYVDNLLPFFEGVITAGGDPSFPGWWGRQSVHTSHQAMLLRKQRDHYQRSLALDDDIVEALLVRFPSYVWPRDETREVVG